MTKQERPVTKHQKNLLRPHAAHFQEMVAFIVTRDVDELTALHEACRAADPSNCGWDTYRAAQFMLNEIEIEQHQRLKNRAALADVAVAETKS